MQVEVSLTIQMPLTNGNDGRGNKWFSSSKLRKQFEAYLRAEQMVPDDGEGFTEAWMMVTRVLGPEAVAMGLGQLRAWQPKRAD